MDEGGTVRELIEHHRSDLGVAADGGLCDRWVVIRVGRLPMPFLNTSARRKALALHDVNHVVAGVSAGNVGEAEISAWELASGGCGKFWAAWALDLAGMLLGMIWPIHVVRAFAAGRRMTNAYRCDIDEVMDMDLEVLRVMLARNEERTTRAVVESVALFIAYLILAIPVGVVFLVLVLFSLPIWAFTKDKVAVA